MADIIRVNYQALEEMKSHCEKVAGELEDLAASAGKWKGTMESGALQGPPGEKFCAALEKLAQQVNRLAQLFETEASDIQGAMDDMQAHDEEAGGKF